MGDTNPPLIMNYVSPEETLIVVGNFNTKLVELDFPLANIKGGLFSSFPASLKMREQEQ